MPDTTNKNVLWPIVFGIVIYLLFLAITLPADIAIKRLQSHGLIAAGVSGSIWHGRAAVLQVGRIALNDVEWNVHPLRFFAGKLNADIAGKRDTGTVRANIAAGIGKHITIRGLQGAVPIADLGAAGLPGGWQGTMRFDLNEIDLTNNWPTRVLGTVDANNLVGPAYQPTQIGSFHVEFSGTEDRNGVVGNLKSKGDGPFDVTGVLRLKANRYYGIDAQVALRPGAPASLNNALQYLGPPDSQGRRALTMSGTL